MVIMPLWSYTYSISIHHTIHYAWEQTTICFTTHPYYHRNICFLVLLISATNLRVTELVSCLACWKMLARLLLMLSTCISSLSMPRLVLILHRLAVFSVALQLHFIIRDKWIGNHFLSEINHFCLFYIQQIGKPILPSGKFPLTISSQ